ncbi:nuclear transport factor 2 family protein [Pseudomonas sp. NFXW11]|uniref:nuclear transport factor 2 family protein n=1 Tax=Pseudomonas sp. NFXW11 TaxID=2819531 RepID=UPI003CF85DAE
MPNTLIKQAQFSVHWIHQLIHSVFSNPHGDAASSLEQLLPLFAEDFQMVTTGGALIGREQVEQLFRGALGQRPGLQIEISEVRCVWQEGQSAAIRYKETHRLAQVESSRLSLAIIRVQPEATQWLYLHETTCP